MITGVLLGLAAASFQSGSYLFSKRYVSAFERGTPALLVSSHCIMGIFALALLPLFLPSHLPPLSRAALPLILGVAAYLAAQASLFLSLTAADASRVSPLLGLKIFVLAAISISFLGRQYGALQWAGILAGLCAAYLLGTAGTRLSPKGWAAVAAACVFYSISDLCIRRLIGEFEYLGLFRASVVSACLCYVLAGAVAAASMPFVNVLSARRWRLAFPFAVFWFVGILFLFGCFGAIGVVFGNIVQSTRGVISLVLGWAMARLGHERIEGRVTRGVFAIRVAAGVMMTAAIMLFYLG
jgi:drug/metabolite transporter (DMT)-like permease